MPAPVPRRPASSVFEPVLPARRRLLRGALGGALATGLGACSAQGGVRPAAAARGPRLARPDLHPSLVIREVAGLRPRRPEGFRVEAERLGDTLVVHNYGHGGCGVTLSWGTAHLAMEPLLAQPERRVAVLGCGAVGLAQARLLQDHGFKVSLYARELPPDTVSNIAGAQWGPSGLVDSEFRTPAFGERLARAARFAHRAFQLLPDVRYGVRWLPLYMFAGGPEPDLGWDWEQTPELFRSRSHAPGAHPFRNERHLVEFQTMMIEPSIYLPAMMDAFRLAGGQLRVRGFEHRSQVLALPEKVVVNCTGLGARTLFGDDSLVAVKGQLTVLVPQHDVDYAVIDRGTYLFPRRDGLLLGGTHERGVWDPAPDAATSERILAAHRRLFATLDAAPAR